MWVFGAAVGVSFLWSWMTDSICVPIGSAKLSWGPKNILGTRELSVWSVSPNFRVKKLRTRLEKL